ncbi:MAG: Fur family transcriptional regulator [Acholeplasmataceae bacterium]
MKMTKQRQMIYTLLKESKHPLNAENILAILPDDAMNLSTVYRTLDAFFEHGLVSKSFLKQTTYYYLNQKEHHHYMICLQCHKMIEIDCHLEDIAHQTAKDLDFQITHHDMTIYGYCHACQER